jgi:SAM-dependent methyltransferase
VGWRQRIRLLLPERSRSRLERLAAPARALFYTGSRRECPCCGGRFRRFVPGGTRSRREATCPRCGSLERHRLLWLYLRERTPLFHAPLRVLHVAPEPPIAKALAALPALDYVTADLNPARPMLQLDETAIPYPDESFDAILCIHVLEHVPADRLAMRELHRVLRRGGFAVLQSPVRHRQAATYEDPTITTPAGRHAAFGQADHLRVYGKDYRERLAAAGFQVTVDRFARSLGPALRQRYGLKRERIYLCTRPDPGAPRA